jgi:hypothetical protein
MQLRFLGEYIDRVDSVNGQDQFLVKYDSRCRFAGRQIKIKKGRFV